MSSCNPRSREALVVFSTHVNLVCRSLVSIVWLSCILPEIHGQEENLSLEDETEPGVTGEVPAVSVSYTHLTLPTT